MMLERAKSRSQGGRRADQGRQRGMTLLELIIACSILLILATAAMPVARFTVMRQKEAELRRDLREMRDAIDRYKDAADRNLIRVAAGTEGYPPDLDTLVQGVEIVAQPGAGPGAGTPAGRGVAGGLGGLVAGSGGSAGSGAPGASGASSSGDQEAIHRVRFLRKIPVDPMTGHAEWGKRAVQDDPDSNTWSGKNVFDVYSLSQGTALDGTKYSDW